MFHVYVIRKEYTLIYIFRIDQSYDKGKNIVNWRTYNNISIGQLLKQGSTVGCKIISIKCVLWNEDPWIPRT